VEIFLAQIKHHSQQILPLGHLGILPIQTPARSAHSDSQVTRLPRRPLMEHLDNLSSRRQHQRLGAGEHLEHSSNSNHNQVLVVSLATLQRLESLLELEYLVNILHIEPL
jgi:hypothetical protein